MLEALLYFLSRSLILAPNIRQGKHCFSVLVCCTGSSVFSRAALKEISKIGLESKVIRSEAHFLRLKQLNITKSINKAPDISKCRPSKYREVVQRKFQHQTLYSRRVIWRKGVRAVRLIADSNALGRF